MKPTKTPEAGAGTGGSDGDAARRTLAMRIAHRNRLRNERLARLHAAPAPAVEAAGSAAGKSVEKAAETTPPAESFFPEEADAPLPPEPAPLSNTPRRSAVAAEASDAGSALEEFLRALTRSGLTAAAAGTGGAGAGGTAPAPEPASVLPFQRPAEAAPTPEFGAGPGPFGLSEPRAAPICDLHLLEGAGPGLIWALQRAGIACLAELAPLEATELASRLGYLGRLVPAEAWIAAARAE
jgi:predicted flap endonuclease-1-like 5' DNA nuclease